MHSNLTLAMIAKMVIITFGNFDRYSDYKINRGKFEYSILAQGNNLKMLNNRIPSRTSLISTKTGKLDKPLQHLFINPPFVFVFKLLFIITAPLHPPLQSHYMSPKIVWLRNQDLATKTNRHRSHIIMHTFKASHHQSLKMT